MTIGERIKKIRKELDLTQAEFAESIGSVQNSVTGYETGRRNPSQPVIALICNKFNVNKQWLLTGEGEMFVKLSRTDEIAEFVGKVLHSEEDSFKRRFVAMLSLLDEKDWEVLEKMVNEMKKD